MFLAAVSEARSAEFAANPAESDERLAQPHENKPPCPSAQILRHAKRTEFFDNE